VLKIREIREKFAAGWLCRVTAGLPVAVMNTDPTLPETFDSVHEVFADLRTRCPVAHSDAFEGFWAITRYSDVIGILQNPDLYITSIRNVVPGSARTVGGLHCT